MATATEREFLDAIRRAPDDAVAVQVYGDWLLDQGDPRGELIALQAREAELDAPHVLRLLQLAAEHGFIRVPDDPERDVLRFAGGVVTEGAYRIVYEVVHRGCAVRVVESRTELRIDVDNNVVRTDKPRVMITPHAACSVLAEISAAILAGEPLAKIELVTAANLRIGRFPTDRVPDDIAALWPPGVRHIDFRDLARWRALANRWRSARST
ncbi:MAG TPA: TIGR02996 domain-containing protein [Kofleriaceae bacterium]|nr:TIGR02996 domain-containing protein [Kofleriaceae bacterium]